MVNFELGEETEKDVFRHVTSVGQRKILSPYKESNVRPSDSALRCSATVPKRLYSDRGLLRSSKTHALHTARISNVDSVLILNRIREIVSFLAR